MLLNRKINSSDIETIVDIHLQAFSGFFLSSLGKSFLLVYYKSFIKNSDSIAICAISAESKILGFCVGTVHSDGFHKRLLMENKLAFGWQFFKILFKQPRSILRLFFNLEKESLERINGNVAELLSIGVTNQARGTGVGMLMIQEYEKIAKSKNATVISLTTDYFNNDHVINFYKKAGYEFFCDFLTYPNRKMYKMIKYL